MEGDYAPVGLAEFANFSLAEYQRLVADGDGSYLEERESPSAGAVSLRGIPFQIGAGDKGGPNPLVAPFDLPGHTLGPINVGRVVSGVVVAHVLLGSDIWRGAPFARQAATYRFTFSDGEVVEVPVRERMEIGNMPLPWGQYPLLAVPDRHDAIEDQFDGQFERAGFRQTEVQPSTPAAYFLWYWRSEKQQVELTSIEVEAAMPGMIVAGITCSFVDEDPVGLRTRLTARIEVPQDPLGRELRVSVDRGVATYPQPLPERPLDEEDPAFAGWGAPRADGSAGWYVNIAAAPSATVTLKRGDEIVGAVRWGDVQERGGVRGDRCLVRLIDSGRNWMRITVLDADTGEPVNCRLALQTAEGVPYAPHGHHTPIYSGLENWNVDVGGDVRLGQVTYAYIDGTAEGWVPRGDVIVDIARGFEYEGLRSRIKIEPGQRELLFTIRRWIDMNASGWYSGDTHVHFLSAQGSLREAAGEDLNVVNLLQTQWGHLFTSTEEFTGRPMSSPDARHVVWVSQENREHVLGHLGLIGLRKPVMPWASGGPGEGELGGSLETTEAHWADAAHDRGAIVVLAHFPTPNAEAPVLVATGRADAVEMYDQLEYEHLEYYRYLNDGYQLPLVAGTDKMASGVPVGMYRTYAYIGEGTDFTFDEWVRAVCAGHTFISSGPMLEMRVDGEIVGSTLLLEPGSRVEVTCAASSRLPLYSLQLIERGVVIKEESSADPSRRLELSAEVQVDGPTWLAARCGGPHYRPVRHFDDSERGIMAHTSPVYIGTGGEYRLRDPDTAEYMRSVIAAGREYVRRASPQYPEASVTHHHTHPDHLAFLELPFREAEQRIAERSRTIPRARNRAVSDDPPARTAGRGEVPRVDDVRNVSDEREE